MSHGRKTLLVTGATGRQGAALISSLLSSASSTGVLKQAFRILALTRNPSSPAAQSLLSSSQKLETDSELSLVKGDLDDLTSVREVFQTAEGGIWGVFTVLAFPGLGVSTDGEEKQGIALADLSLEFGVSHFVYTSAERGGEAFDDQLAAERGAKVKIERHVKSLSASGLKWTILRPSFFMENFNGTLGRITVGVMQCGLRPTTKMQLIAAADIGHVAAAVFQDPETNIGKIIPVVGDVLTPKEQDEAYKRATGHGLPSVPSVFAKLVLALNSHIRDLTRDLERMHRDRSAMEGGYERVLQDVRSVYPGMMSFEEWAKRQAETKADRREGWNNVSILDLILGRR